MKEIRVKDKDFSLFIPQEQIMKEIDRVAQQMSEDLAETNPLFLCVLNGAFMFASELMKRISSPLELSFVKLSSYQGVSSTGAIKQLLGINENIEGRTVVIVEDIVDTGYTMQALIQQLQQHNPKEVKIATLLHKPEALKVNLTIDYVALEIPSDFIVGFGLDYDGYGRNLPDIYKIIEK